MTAGRDRILDESDSPRGWEELARAHHDAILAFARAFARDPHDASDITQEVLLRLGVTSALPETWSNRWLWTVVRNVSIDHHRRSVRLRWVDLDDYDVASDSPSPADAAIQDEDFAAVRAALTALPAEFRTVMELRYESDLTYEEISRVIGVPVGTVRSRLHRARARLVALLQNRLELAS